ncbi:unnamed protein product [Protopolystoma xenopodis]|uniref:Uncharacterized protein n=1 Tax=Protopolystoma xenopodis TaxID=117903 RepID=A0A448WRD1_9PLAT|nr:unnamed protein product [Protopolystoma xenopodis]
MDSVLATGFLTCQGLHSFGRTGTTCGLSIVPTRVAVRSPTVRPTVGPEGLSVSMGVILVYLILTSTIMPSCLECQTFAIHRVVFSGSYFEGQSKTGFGVEASCDAASCTNTATGGRVDCLLLLLRPEKETQHKALHDCLLGVVKAGVGEGERFGVTRQRASESESQAGPTVTYIPACGRDWPDLAQSPANVYLIGPRVVASVGQRKPNAGSLKNPNRTRGFAHSRGTRAPRSARLFTSGLPGTRTHLPATEPHQIPPLRPKDSHVMPHVVSCCVASIMSDVKQPTTDSLSFSLCLVRRRVPQANGQADALAAACGHVSSEHRPMTCRHERGRSNTIVANIHFAASQSQNIFRGEWGGGGGKTRVGGRRLDLASYSSPKLTFNRTIWCLNFHNRLGN